jgi:pyruvate/2-oxoglutarate dehydrogenase complex dihydrolipoamide dehydrogenase (E3) component
VDYAALPRITFTSPAIASAGLAEAELVRQGVACDCRVLPLEAVPRAAVGHDTRGVVKLVAEAGTGRVRGPHVVTDGAGEVIVILVLDHGRLAGHGTHSELLARSGLYATLYERQFLAQHQPAASQAVTI